MNVMNKFKNVFVYIVVFLFACSQNENTHEILYLVYQGVIPCADCEGINVTLKISDDFQSYELYELYLGKTDKPFVEKGNLNTERGFEEDEDATVYVLNYDKPEDEQRYFVRLSKDMGSIIMLDKNRKIIQSELNYKLLLISPEL